MGRDHRGSSSRASNRSSDTNRNTRIPAPKSSSQSSSSSSSRRPSSRMIINMTTTITTSGAHSGLIVQSGVASAPAASHHQRQSDPWSLPSVSSPLPSLTSAAPLPIAAPVIEEIPPTTSEDEQQHYAPPSSTHSTEMPRLTSESPYATRPSTYQAPRYEETEREEEEVSYLDPQDVQLNTFNTNPPPAPSDRLSRRDLPMRPDTTSTTTYMEIYREPGDPLHAYQRLALPPNQKPDLLYGPRYEQWANTRTSTLIDDRGGKAVQWKSDLVETDDEAAPPPSIGQTRGRDASSSPSYVRARSRETRQDTKNGRVIKESISDEDITIETRSAALSPRLFSPSSTGSARIGEGVSPAPPRIGWGAAPAPTPLPIVTSPSIGAGARPLSPMSVDTRYSGVGYGAAPSAASRARSPDDYHDALRRRASPSPLRRTAASPLYAPSRAYSPGLEYNSSYARPPPSYRSDSRYDSPPPQGELDRAKSSEDPNVTAISDPVLSRSFSFHEEGPSAAAPVVQQPAAAAAAPESYIYAAPRVAAAPDSPIYATSQVAQREEPPASPIYTKSQIRQPAAVEEAKAAPQESAAFVTSHFRLVGKPAAAAAVTAARVQEPSTYSSSRALQPEISAAVASDSVIYANLKISRPVDAAVAEQESAKASSIYATSQLQEIDKATTPSRICAPSHASLPQKSVGIVEEEKHSPIYATSQIRLPHKTTTATETTFAALSPLYAPPLVQKAAVAKEEEKHSPIYAATQVRHPEKAATETTFSASPSPIYAPSHVQTSQKASPIYAAPSIIRDEPPAIPAPPTTTTFEVVLPAEDFGLRLSQLSPRRDCETQTELPQPPPRPPPPTFARPMHRTASYRQSLPPSVRLRDEHIYDQIPMERDTRRHSFTCPPAFISRRSLEKIVHCLNEFPKNKKKSEDFTRPSNEGRLQRSQSVRAAERRPSITRIPVERVSSEEEGPYESAERKPIRVTIDYDPRYAKVVKPARPPPPRKSLSSSATFAPSSRSIRERSPSKIVRIINGRSYSVDGGRRGRHRPMGGTSPTPPDPRTSTAPVPPAIETIPASRPTSALIDTPPREEERKDPPPLAKERFEEKMEVEESRGRERSKPPPRPPPPILLKSAPSESLFVIPARRTRSMSERPSARAARMPELPEDTDAPAPLVLETPGISLSAGAHFEPFPVKERESVPVRERASTVAVDEPHGEEVPHDSPHVTHSPKKATPRQLKRRSSQEFDDLISFTDDAAVQRPEFLEMAPEPEPEPQIRPVPAPRTTTPTGIGSNPNLSMPDPNLSVGSSPSVVVDEHRLRIIGLDDIYLS